MKKDSLKQLISVKETIQFSPEESYVFFLRNEYDFNLEEISDYSHIGFLNQIIDKEKNRISTSQYAARKVDLIINLLNGGTSIFKSSFKDYTFHTFYTYLFEDLKKSKLFFTKIEYIDAGGGSKNITLLELNLKNGKVRNIIEDSGGDFFFNSTNTYIIASGWVQSDEDEYANDCKLELINLVNLKKELVFDGIEPVEIKWNLENEFKCMLLSYAKEIEWPFVRIPNEIRTSELFHFKIEDSIWQGYSTINNEKTKIAVIGSKIWMAENLNISTFRNGDIIPEAKTEAEWRKAGENGKPAWCYYDNDSKNLERYGKLYNWYAVNDPRGLAPIGWEVSEIKDWKEIERSLGEGSEWIAGWKIRTKKMWQACNGTNESGFSALPNGKRNDNGDFEGFNIDESGNLGYWGGWWNKDEKSNQEAFSTELNGGCMDGGYIGLYPVNKKQGLSIRCIKDSRNK